MMTENDFAALLGIYCNSSKAVTIKGAIALMQDVLYNLMPDQQVKDSELRGATVVEWNSSSILLKDSEGKLYRMAPDDDGDLAIDQDDDLAFSLLSVEGSLGKVFDIDAVAELGRLKAEAVEDARSKGRDCRTCRIEAAEG